MPSISPERFLTLRKQGELTQEQMGKLLGVSAKYIGMIERGDKAVEEHSSLGLLFRTHEGRPSIDGETADRVAGAMVSAAREAAGQTPFEARARAAIAEDLRDGRRGRRGGIKMIPVLSWAHAGTAENFEEIPESWQDKVPTECRDEKAFAVRLLGDSMAPLYVEGDMLILQPSREIYSGCLAVIRLANDGILFRRVEVRGERLQLVPLNPQYRMEEFSAEEISWAYPLWGMWRQVCK